MLFMLLAMFSCSDSKKPQRDANGVILKNGQFYDSQEEETNMVWICTGKSSHAYHSTDDCYGIKACKGKKKRISLDEAVSMGRTPCHYCHGESTVGANRNYTERYTEEDIDDEEEEEFDDYDPDRYDSREQYDEYLEEALN